MLEEKQNEMNRLKTNIKRTQISDLIHEKEEYYLEVNISYGSFNQNSFLWVDP